MSANPLLEPWTTPFEAPPFDQICPEHFVPAYERGMAEHLSEVAMIGADPAEPDFGNTIEAMERAGRTLGRVGAVFGNLVLSLGGDALEAVDTEMAPRLAAHGMTVSLDPALFARVERLWAKREELELEADQRRLLDRVRRGFIRSGAALDETGRARMAAISERLAVLHTAFGQNVVHDEKDWHLPLGADDLDGLPEFVREGAAQAARERGLDGHVVTLSRSLIEPFLCFSTRRDLRRIAWEAWTRRGMHSGTHDNRPLIPEILALRAEKARLLGYADFAAFRLDDSMAGTPDRAEALLRAVWEPAKRRAAAEEARLAELARADGINDGIAPFDWRFYAEKLRQAEYELDEAALKPFFPLERIQQAAFDTAGKLFGLAFHPRPDVPVYHPDVRAFEVRDGDGHVGLFLLDHLARPGKRSGAWMSSYRDQEAMDEVIAPIIVNNNNFAGTGGTVLLSFDDARTLFHEFGHALHGLLSRVRYPTQSGTSVKKDFVEFPSQVLEHWMELPETLRTYARHHRTGEAIAEEQIGRILRARTFNQGFGTVEFTSSALADMALHRLANPGELDIEVFEAEFRAANGVPAAIALRHRPAHFQHLFAGGGYAAGYYAYMWSEVLDADGFEAFTEAGDAFDPATASRLRRVLEAGDTVDPMELYVAFRGREPRMDALLAGRGLAA